MVGVVAHRRVGAVTYDPREPVERTLLRMHHNNEHRRAIERIREAFTYGSEPYLRRAWTERGGLSVVRARRWWLPWKDADEWCDADLLRTPFGWRRRKVESRDANEFMPLWLYWLVALWDVRWDIFRLLHRLGLWHTQEGERWTSGRLTAPHWLRALVWCFLHDRDVYDPYHFSRCFFARSYTWRTKNLMELKKRRFELPAWPESTAGAALIIKSEM